MFMGSSLKKKKNRKKTHNIPALAVAQLVKAWSQITPRFRVQALVKSVPLSLSPSLSLPQISKNLYCKRPGAGSQNTRTTRSPGGALMGRYRSGGRTLGPVMAAAAAAAGL